MFWLRLLCRQTTVEIGNWHISILKLSLIKPEIKVQLNYWPKDVTIIKHEKYFTFLRSSYRLGFLQVVQTMNLVAPIHSYKLQEDRRWINKHNWQKWKRVFLTCPCHKIYKVEAVCLKNCKYTWKITIFVKIWNLGQYRENLIFCQ